MPASDQTWYNMQRLHKAFAISSVLLLLATFLLLAVDHRRSWKAIQRTADRVDLRFAEWQRMQQLTEDAQAERRRLSAALSEVRAGALSADALRRFRQEMEQDAASRDEPEVDFTELDSRLDALRPAVEAAQRAARRWQDARLAADKAALELEDAERRMDGSSDQDEARQAVTVARRALAAANEAVAAARRQKDTSQAAASPLRRAVFDWLRSVIQSARFREDDASRQRKFVVADLDAAKARRDIALRQGAPSSQIELLAEEIREREAQLSQVNSVYEDAAAHRHNLQRLLDQLTNEEEAIRDRLAENEREQRRLDQLLRTKQSAYFTFQGPLPLPGKRWLELPVIDAFNSPRKIDNVWSEDLDRKLGSFGRVNRFDRCTTCHQAIDKVLPSNPTRGAYAARQSLQMFITWPGQPPAAWQQLDEDAQALNVRLDALLGIQLADEGLLDPQEVTIRFVRPESLATNATTSIPQASLELGGVLRDQWLKTESTSGDADAVGPGLLVGDVITSINGAPVAARDHGPEQAGRRLIEAAIDYWQGREDGTDPDPVLRLTIKRGLPSPYHSHPRLDLYLGSFSPHKLSEFGCTVCHEGQGSATEFKWVSHTPNDEAARQRWRERYGWFDNPHWEFPMYAQRFVESSCLKCHHDVSELEPDDRLSQPPAAKVVRGFKLIRQHGCFGCHEINGYDGAGRRVGPDLRVEPPYAAAAAQIKGAPGTGYQNLTAEEKQWIEQIMVEPDNAEARHNLYDLIVNDARLASDSRRAVVPDVDANSPSDQRSEPRFSRYVHQELAPLLRDQQHPGRLRKVGPSLRYAGSKLTTQSLVQWVSRPSRFRPDTRMPQFFELWRHLPPVAQSEGDATEDGVRPEAELERVEVLSMVHFLQRSSQPFDYETPPAEIAEVNTDEDRRQQVQRGKLAFEESGCLACHSHVDFPEMEAYRERDAERHGPDLSDVSARFAAEVNPQGARWLYSWIKNPLAYHPRTRMPSSRLEPVTHRDESGSVTHITDPIADITAYLLSVPADNSATKEDGSSALSDSENITLTGLARQYMRQAVFEKTADRFVAEGIPASRRSEFEDAEAELIIEEAESGRVTETLLIRKRMMYVGRKSIAKYGCYACHDIPGFENARAIGPALSEWGRVDPHMLAFEHIVQYVSRPSAEARSDVDTLENPPAADDGSPPQTQLNQFYRRQLESNSRIGFIYQKIAEPRSYDYRKTEFKPYNDRLRMPQFRFDDEQREAIICFVLGLVADPPRSKYVYRADERRQQLHAGRQLLEDYNCGGCHIRDAELWELAFEPNEFGPQIASASYPLLVPDLGEQAHAASLNVDRRGLRKATIEGMPAISDDGKPDILEEGEFPLAEEENEEFDTSLLTYRFDLWKPTVVDGHVYQVGQVPMLISRAQLRRRQGTVGGALVKYLLPRVVAREHDVNPDAKGREAWGWLPPPLVGQGQRVQPEWLHNYLLDPQLIRPAVAMKMPRFSLSQAEAQTLADYFAIKDGAPFPYEFDRQRTLAHLAEADARYAQVLTQADESGNGAALSLQGRHLEDAMKIVTDANYCIKCHIVGDFDPVASNRAKAPDLSQVYSRLRSEHLRRWLARPASVLPYTSMPVNIPYSPDEELLGTTVPQQLYRGNSLEQLEALVDLLMNFDRYTGWRSPISPLVRESNSEPSSPAPSGSDADP